MTIEVLRENNMQKIREALEFVAHMNDSPYTTYDVLVAVQKARSALSNPLRNCDVGTAEEQAERLFFQHGDTTLGAEVALAWAQMPYEEGGGKQ